MQYVRLDLVTVGPWYVVLRSTLQSYYTRKFEINCYLCEASRDDDLSTSEVDRPTSRGESLCHPEQVPGGGAAPGPLPVSQLSPEPCQIDLTGLT